jgi:hypothetical protein
MVLMMVYNTQNYWVFGLFPSSGILENTRPQVKVGEKTPTQLGPLERSNLNHWTPLSDLHSYLINMACLISPISQPSLDISPIWIPLISNEVSNSQRRSVWRDRFSIGFHKVSVSSVQVLLHRWHWWYYYMSSQKCSHFFAWVLVHSVLLVMFVAKISTAFSIPVPRMWMLDHNFYCVISRYLPLN